MVWMDIGFPSVLIIVYLKTAAGFDIDKEE
jgi:hypothetical protein